jgi:uncharacterized damage-inducible protein DinB
MNAREWLLEPVAYMPPERALDGLAPQEAEWRPAGASHSVAEIVSHLAFWQGWFLRRLHSSPDPMPPAASLGWPEVAPESWPEVRRQFLDGLRQAVEVGEQSALLDRPLAPSIEFPPLSHYTVRDALIHMAVHNAHHLGQVVTVRQMIGAWPPPSGSYTW